MWLALIVVIGVTLGRMIWVCAADVLAFGRENKPVTITVYESDTMDSITDKLYDAGLIRYKSLFNFYADISHAGLARHFGQACLARGGVLVTGRGGGGGRRRHGLGGSGRGRGIGRRRGGRDVRIVALVAGRKHRSRQAGEQQQRGRLHGAAPRWMACTG